MFHMGNSWLALDHQKYSGDNSVNQECHGVKKACYKLGCINILMLLFLRLVKGCSIFVQHSGGLAVSSSGHSKYRECAQKSNRMIKVILTFVVWKSTASV